MRYIYFKAGFSPYKQHQHLVLSKTSQKMIFVSQDLRDKPIVQKLSFISVFIILFTNWYWSSYTINTCTNYIYIVTILTYQYNCVDSFVPHIVIISSLPMGLNSKLKYFRCIL